MVTTLRWFLALTFLCLAPAMLLSQDPTNQHYEFRQYVDVVESRQGELDAYLEKALVPALNRRGHKPVGVLADAKSNEGKLSYYLIIPMKSPQDLATLQADLVKDAEYQAAAKSYLETAPKSPLYARIRSELLVAFNCWPELKVPPQTAENKPRLFELRTYESATEERGAVKVDMFNNGEVPIFLDSGITPVFFGQALIGDKTPNLTYMTVYDNAEVRDQGWKKFIQHPDWKVLSAEPKYQNTVSKIYKSDLLPRPYSQL